MSLKILLVVLLTRVSLSLSAPSVPRSFTLGRVDGSPSELEANWTVPASTNGIIRNYTVECNNSLAVFNFDDSGEEISSDSMLLPELGSGGPAQMVTALLSGLAPFTVYECTVSASTNGGRGEASEAAVATTDEDGSLYLDTFLLAIICGD